MQRPMIGTGGPALGTGEPSRRALGPKWIAVDDKLPDIDDRTGYFSDRVLVRVVEHDGSARVSIDSYCGRRWRWSANGDRVTHWQPLLSAELGP